MKFNKNINNTINLLKGQFGKSKINIESNCWYKFVFQDECFYYMHNNNSKILEITTVKETLTTKAQNIYLSDLPLSVKKLVVDIESEDVKVSKEEVHLNQDGMVLSAPYLLYLELSKYEYFNKNETYNHLFQYQLRDDLAEVLVIENRGTNVYVSQNDEPIRTLLHTQYDHETKMLYSDSWTYIIKCIESIDKKVETLPMLKQRKLREETRNLVHKLSNTIIHMSYHESFDLASFNNEIDLFINSLQKHSK